MGLSEAHEALQRRDALAALDLLLHAWRSNRAVAIADAIDALSERITRALPPIDGRTRRAFNERWIDVASAGHVADVGRLLAALRRPTWSVMPDRIRRLEHRPDDPRIALAFASFIDELPSTTSVGEPAFNAMLRQIARIGDARTRPLLERRQATPAGGVFGDYLRSALERTLPKLPAAAPELSSEDAQWVRQIRDELVAMGVLSLDERQLTAPALKPSPMSERELLDQILREPDDDAPRQAYADFLQERGDVRGEFIALQLTDRRKRAASKRAKELLRAHRRAWLGSIEPVVAHGTERFERGFLAACSVDFRTPAQWESLLDHPEWSTLRTLDVPAPDRNETHRRFLLGCALSGLKAIEGTMPFDYLRALASRQRPLGVEEAAIFLARDHVDAPIEGTSLPRLVRLEVNLAYAPKIPPEQFMRALGTLEQRLESLVIDPTWWEVSLPDWFERATARLPRLARLAVSSQRTRYAFARGGDGAWGLSVSGGFDVGARLPWPLAIFRRRPGAPNLAELQALRSRVRTVEVDFAPDARSEAEIRRALDGFEVTFNSRRKRDE